MPDLRQGRGYPTGARSGPLWQDERLADTLRWYQTHHAVDDEHMAARMNACPAVIGIRSRKDDDAHAPIAPAKVTRFKDRKTRPQTQTLAQMTAFFGDTLNMPPFLFWTDLDDVMTAFHDARRFRKERTRKDLLALILDPNLAGLGLLTPAKTQSRKAREDAATNFWRSVHGLRNLIQATASH